MSKCSRHYGLRARKRINLLIDKGTFMEFNSDVEFQNPLNFPKYKEKVDSYKEKQRVRSCCHRLWKNKWN